MCRCRMLIAVLAAMVVSVPIVFAEPTAIAPQDFEKLRQLIRRAADESRWLGMDWLTSVWEARQKAADEGKPILLWSGGGAPPLGGC